MPARVSTAPLILKWYDAADEVFWAAKLNLLWLLFTLLGGVLLGLGPATLAAYTLARRHALNETFRALPAFWAAYRHNFLRGTALLLPITFLTSNYLWFATLGPAADIPRLLTLAALAATAVITSYLLPMAVHYDLRTRDHLPKASLFALTRPAASLLLLFLLLAAGYATVLFPLLALTVTAGGWIQLNTWLCLRFFAENEARLRTERIS